MNIVHLGLPETKNPAEAGLGVSYAAMEAGLIALVLGLGAFALIEAIPLDVRRTMGGVVVLVTAGAIALQLLGVL